MNLKPWPFLLAAGVLVLGVRSFVKKYPETSTAAQRTGAPVDSVLPAVLRAWPGLSDTGESVDTAVGRDPFHTSIPAHGVGKSAHTPKAVPGRKWSLTGTVGDVVAMIIDSVGVKHLLRVGESVGGTKLIEVQGDHARLRDAGGEFEIGLEP